jgi:hypothetical protein
MAGDSHGLPLRVRAPHLGDWWIGNCMGLFLQFPLSPSPLPRLEYSYRLRPLEGPRVGHLFRSPIRLIRTGLDTWRRWPRRPSLDVADYRLPSLMDVHVFNCHLLLALAAMPVERLKQS